MLVGRGSIVHEIARPVAVVELMHQDFVPGVLAGAGRAGQAEVSRIGDAGGGRVWIVEVGLLSLTSRNIVEKPSIFFSNSGSTASGVTSRPVKPVPPVVITTSMNLSAIQSFTRWRIAFYVVLDDRPLGQRVAGGADALGQRVAGLVVGALAGIGHREYRDLERNELAAFRRCRAFPCVLKVKPPRKYRRPTPCPASGPW